jgi:hypothetical protein
MPRRDLTQSDKIASCDKIKANSLILFIANWQRLMVKQEKLLYEWNLLHGQQRNFPKWSSEGKD